MAAELGSKEEQTSPLCVGYERDLGFDGCIQVCNSEELLTRLVGTWVSRQSAAALLEWGWLVQGPRDPGGLPQDGKCLTRQQLLSSPRYNSSRATAVLLLLIPAMREELSTLTKAGDRLGITLLSKQAFAPSRNLGISQKTGNIQRSFLSSAFIPARVHSLAQLDGSLGATRPLDI